MKGRTHKGAATSILAVLAIGLVGIGFAFVGTQTDAGPFNLIDSGPDEAPDQDQDQPTQNMLTWKDHELPLDVVSPVSSDFTATAFVESPDEDGDYGNYDKYNASDATSGLTVGVDYYQESDTGTKSVTFPANLKLPAGSDLQFAIEDTANTPEFHDAFTDASVPSEVSEIDYENDNAQTIVSSDAFIRRPDVSKDSAEIQEVNGDSVDFANFDGSATNIKASAYDSETGETMEVERVIELNHGKAALGEVDVANVSDDLSSGEVTITYMNSDGEEVELFNKEVANDGSADSDVNLEIPDLEDGESLGANPEFAGDEIIVTYDLEFDGSSVSANEVLLDVGIQNIYGNYVGSQNTVDAKA